MIAEPMDTSCWALRKGRESICSDDATVRCNERRQQECQPKRKPSMYTPHNFRTGAGAYARLGVETQAMSASPHQLICMLFDGAIWPSAWRATTSRGRHRGQGACDLEGRRHRRQRPEGQPRCEGGRPSRCGTGSQPVGAVRLVVRRLLQASLRDDLRALDEAQSLRQAWRRAWRRSKPAAPPTEQEEHERQRWQPAVKSSIAIASLPRPVADGDTGARKGMGPVARPRGTVPGRHGRGCASSRRRSR